MQLLQSDVLRLEDGVRDEKSRMSCIALADNQWAKEDETVALSWKRAEELINAVRRGLGVPPLQLAQTGGEGTVDRTTREAFEPLGWSIEPLDTSAHDPVHLDSPEDPARRAPVLRHSLR
jgi:hypothetical protein